MNHDSSPICMFGFCTMLNPSHVKDHVLLAPRNFLFDDSYCRSRHIISIAIAIAPSMWLSALCTAHHSDEHTNRGNATILRMICCAFGVPLRRIVVLL